MADYEARTTKTVVMKSNEPIFHESATEIEIIDDGAGEYVQIRQTAFDPLVKISPEEWPLLRDTIEKMIQECRA